MPHKALEATRGGELASSSSSGVLPTTALPVGSSTAALVSVVCVTDWLTLVVFQSSVTILSCLVRYDAKLVCVTYIIKVRISRWIEKESFILLSRNVKKKQKTKVKSTAHI